MRINCIQKILIWGGAMALWGGGLRIYLMRGQKGSNWVKPGQIGSTYQTRGPEKQTIFLW